MELNNNQTFLPYGSRQNFSGLRSPVDFKEEYDSNGEQQLSAIPSTLTFSPALPETCMEVTASETSFSTTPSSDPNFWRSPVTSSSYTWPDTPRTSHGPQELDWASSPISGGQLSALDQLNPPVLNCFANTCFPYMTNDFGNLAVPCDKVNPLLLSAEQPLQSVLDCEIRGHREVSTQCHSGEHKQQWQNLRVQGKHNRTPKSGSKIKKRNWQKSSQRLDRQSCPSTSVVGRKSPGHCSDDSGYESSRSKVVSSQHPCQWPDCSGRFGRSEHLKRHVRRHLPPTEKRNFFCPLARAFGEAVCDRDEGHPIQDRGDNLTQHFATHCYGNSSHSSRNTTVHRVFMEALLRRTTEFEERRNPTMEQRDERIESMNSQLKKKMVEHQHISKPPRINAHIDHKIMGELFPEGFIACGGLGGICQENFDDAANWYEYIDNQTPWCCIWVPSLSKEKRKVGWTEITSLNASTLTSLCKTPGRTSNL